MPGKLRPTLDWFLVFVPIAVVLRYWAGSDHQAALFACSGVAIVPLARLMGRATEHLSERLGQGMGALLNATFGNAAELIIALMALQKGLVEVVKASITGSIIGNILLVFGASALVGGFKHGHVRFNLQAVQTSTTSLKLAAIGLLIPAIFQYSAALLPSGWKAETAQHLSLAIALVLFATYFCTLLFSFRNRTRQVQGESGPEVVAPQVEPMWSLGKSTLVLLVSTALVAWMSEFLVGAVEDTRAALGVTDVFIGVIIVAVIGNAAEHSTAVWMALKNKMDLSLGIAVGSSLQMALFVAPLLVFVSYAFGQRMDLEFTIPEIVAVIVAVHIAAVITSDGETNWLEGLQLLSVYFILGLLFYFLPPAK